MNEVSAANPVSRALFNRALASKRAALARGDASGGFLAPLWDSLVFSKVKAKLGGRVRLLTTGASPISAEVMSFLRVCFPGAIVLEGYGAPSPPPLLVKMMVSHGAVPPALHQAVHNVLLDSARGAG
jgi:long-subunit acyl-CoA synthetase (AMP-forming)